MLRKNWLLKVRHPFVTAAEVLPIDSTFFLISSFLGFSNSYYFSYLFGTDLFPFSFLFLQILLPTIVMLLLIAVRTRVDTKIHPAQP